MPISSSENPSDEAAAFGPYFFAWASENDSFDPAIHTRFDDQIFEYTLDQAEGNFATLAITVKNPRIGLLAPGRQIWGWFSWWNGTAAIPLFFGRLVGLPDNLDEETVVLNFIARPSDFVAQQQAWADSLKVAPYWDPIWFAPVSPDDESAATTTKEASDVLESRPEMWFTDPVTHVVSTSNIINGEDGTVSFDETQILYNTVKVSYSQNPLRSVQMTATVSWDQKGSGTIPVPTVFANAPHSPMKSFTGEGLANSWPSPESSIGGGWKWALASVVPTGMVDSSVVGDIAVQGGGVIYLGGGGSPTYYVDGGFDASLGTWGTDATGQNIGWSYHVAIPDVTLKWTLGLGWDANRRKTEVLTFTLNADVQDILTLPDDNETLKLTMSSSELNGPIDPGGAIPLANQLSRSYFNTIRGAQSIEYLIAIARANLLARARCVNIEFQIPFETAIAAQINLRKNAVISDSHLPGTTVGGKITHYVFAMKNGQQTATITIASTVGQGGTVVAVEGTPDYCEIDYVDGFKYEQASSDHVSEAQSDIINELRYQTYSGRFTLPFASDIVYESILGQPCNDDGIDFLNMTSRIVQNFQLLNGDAPGETQQDALSRFDISVDITGKVTAVNSRYAQITITLPDLTNGPFETDYVLNVSDLKIPKDIDLSAPSEGASSL